MFAKILLVVISITADGETYRDFVAPYASMQECKAAQVKLTAYIKANAPKDSYIFGICTKVTPLNGTKS